MNTPGISSEMFPSISLECPHRNLLRILFEKKNPDSYRAFFMVSLFRKSSEVSFHKFLLESSTYFLKLSSRKPLKFIQGFPQQIFHGVFSEIYQFSKTLRGVLQKLKKSNSRRDFSRFLRRFLDKLFLNS